jgi:hypothetical protein
MIDSWSHATQQEKLLLSIILPFSTMHPYSTNMYIISVKHIMQNYNSKKSRTNHKCPRLFINAVSNAQCTRIASGVNNKIWPGYHFECCIFYWNSVWRLELGMKIEDSRSSEHWQELGSRTNNALRLWVESWQFLEKIIDSSFLPWTRRQQGSVRCWYSSSNYPVSQARKYYSSEYKHAITTFYIYKEKSNCPVGHHAMKT